MASPWINTTVALPADNQWCIIRCSPNYGEPFRARVEAAANGYRWLINDDIGLGIPYYIVVRWKPE